MKSKAARGAVVLLAAIAVLAAACSGSPSPGGSSNAAGSAAARSDVAFSACMRSRGVPNYLDPTTIGGVPALPKGNAHRFGVSSTEYSAAQRACQDLLPATGGSLTASSLQQCYMTTVCPQALVQNAMNAGRQLAECMRSHGAPDWPDPIIDSQGRPLFNIRAPDPPPAPVGAAISDCSRLDHAVSLLAWG